MKESFSNIKGFLFDIDGTLHDSGKLIESAPETIAKLKSNNIPVRFLTNNTTRTAQFIHEILIAFGFDSKLEEVFSPIVASLNFLRAENNPTVFLNLHDSIKDQFSELKTDDVNPDYIIIGDIDNRWNYDLLNKLFNFVMNGSKMIALHKGTYWQQDGMHKLDIGAFVAGLEYATSQEAIVIGKPSKTFFDIVVSDIGLSHEQLAMVGDDLLNDIKGAQDAGLMGVLVKTGKYREELAANSPVKPDLVLDSVADIF